jgi:hypothetical protein
MVKNGQAGRLVSAQSFLGVGYKNLRFPTLGIESLRLSELLSRMPPYHFSRPQRPGFHLLLLFTSGSGDHFLDFRRVSCRPGTLIHARPGQVQQFVLGQTLEADVLLFTPEFLLPAIVDAGGREVGTSIDDVVPDGVAQLEPDALEAMESVIAAISRAYKKTNGLNISAAICPAGDHLEIRETTRTRSPILLEQERIGFSGPFQARPHPCTAAKIGWHHDCVSYGRDRMAAAFGPWLSGRRGSQETRARSCFRAN